MRATGIVRRIDDLGRVVIPKEIRRSLHINDGDPLEIYTAHDDVLGNHLILAKYQTVEVSLSDLLADFRRFMADDNCTISAAHKYEASALVSRLEEIVKK